MCGLWCTSASARAWKDTTRRLAGRQSTLMLDLHGFLCCLTCKSYVLRCGSLMCAGALLCQQKHTGTVRGDWRMKHWFRSIWTWQVLQYFLTTSTFKPLESAVLTTLELQSMPALLVISAWQVALFQSLVQSVPVNACHDFSDVGSCLHSMSCRVHNGVRC